MMRAYFEEWSPQYGSPFDADSDSLPSDGIRTQVETPGPWESLPGLDDGVRAIAFVDGVQRSEGTLAFFPDESVPFPTRGVCASFAVGASVWDRTRGRSIIRDIGVHRVAIFGGGAGVGIPPTSGLRYRSESVPSADMDAIRNHLNSLRRQEEVRLAERLASEGYLVVADGRIGDYAPRDVVGYIKSHERMYLPNPEAGIIGQLRPGERTPLFTIPHPYERYSWYMRVASVLSGHAWSGIVRLEASAGLSLREAKVLADRTAALLPFAAMPLHLDPRAPQNLLPIAGLEKRLRHSLGDEGLARRALRIAVSRIGAEAS